MTIAAHAKVNFTLEVLGVRPDGYHDLRSVVVPVSLADEVSLASADEVALDVCGGMDKRGGRGVGGLGKEDNLAVRAARLMQRVSGRKDGVAISLVKRIPVGGGLGGGSADAAAVMNGLNEMWGLGMPRKELATLGSEIGSDVPALVLGGTVLMEGRGERVDWLDGCETRDARQDGFHLVLANPGVFCSTPEIFKTFDTPLPNRPEILYNIRLAMQAGDGAAVARALQNDLETTATRLHPEIEAARQRLEAAGCLGASMSGSGATVFGIARDAVEAGRIARELQAEGLWSVAVETVR